MAPQGKDVDPEASGTVSIEDFKKLETTLTSSIESQNTKMDELREMIMLLMPKKPASPTTTPLEEDPEVPLKNPNSVNSEEEEKVGDTDTGSASTKKKVGKEEYHEVPHAYSPNPPIPHPHINNRGDPPKLDASSFISWTHQMKSHVSSSSIELWRIIEEGFKAVNPSNLTRREVVDSQLNATALHMIQLAVGLKDMPLIQHFTTAKEAWDGLSELFVGNESMRRNRFEALSNEAEGFYMLDGENHEDMYRRLKVVAFTFRDHGATYVDDAWIKRKYISDLMPFEPIDLKSLQGRHNYHLMTSNEIMQEMSV